MCGIVGYVGDKNTTDVLLGGLSKLEYRGYDSAGIAVLDADHTITVVKVEGRLAALENAIKQKGKLVGASGIGHTRWATHGEPNQVNSHPHGNHRVSIVHNGIIENYRELKKKLLQKGAIFTSETDTEVIVALLDYYYQGDPIEAITKTMTALQGAYALGILFQDFPGKIFAVRKDSPLIVGLGEQEQLIASDIPAILAHTKDYYLIEENEIVVLEKEKVLVLNLDQEEIEKERLTVTWNVEDAEKGGFPHFMLKEIFEQPAVLRKTIHPRLKDGMVDLSGDEIDPSIFTNVEQIHIVACGTASYAGMVGQSLIEQLARIPVRVWIASEFRYSDPILGKHDLVIVVSQSGETADTLAALRLAKESGLLTLAIVNVVGSSIAREADRVLYTWAGPEIAVASTKAYTVQIAVLALLALEIALVRGRIAAAQMRAYLEELLTVPDLLEGMLERLDDCKHAASLFQNADHLFFMGRGMDYALSMEGSLKLKEISYIHSEAYAAGELKHGTISLITDQVPVVAIATQSHLYEKMCANIQEVVSRGAKVLLVVNESFAVPEGLATFVIKIPAVQEMFLPLLGALPMQLFAYYTAVLRGCDVDQPRNLAKSVTVE